MSTELPNRRTQRVRHETRRREVKVLRVEPVGVHFVSIVFTGESLSDFVSDSFDDHVKFMFVNESGQLVRRDYTPRCFDRERRELTIEFALHGGGEACEWARRAAPGMPATIGGPKSSTIIPTDYPWHLLAGDSTALPAIHRRLLELPSQVHAFVLVQVVDASERRELASAARLDIHWLSPVDDLAAHLRALSLPSSEGFAWCAGEAAAMASVRDALLIDKQHPREAMRVVAYWKQSAANFHEKLAG
jgi:NADPH-dependent ferric siderophore reductase